MVDSLEGFPEGLPTEAIIAVNAALTEQKEAIEQIRQLDVGGGVQLDLPERYLRALGAVPFCGAKLACGALIVGPACEVRNLRAACDIITDCCQDLRNSTLLQKFLFTSLAVGNVLNRATARSGAQGVLLPDSLLKLEELHGLVETEDEGKGPSVLDFVVQAVTGEPGAHSVDAMKDECDALLVKVRAAQNQSLDDADASCRKIVAEAARAWQALSEVPNSPGVNRVAEKVCDIRQEAGRAMSSITKGRSSLTQAFAWSCAKAGTKVDDWFAGWATFLEQLSSALLRAKPPTPRVPIARSWSGQFTPRSGQVTPRQATPRAGQGSVSAPMVRAASSSKIEALRPGVVLDDDVRIEHIAKPTGGGLWETAARAKKEADEAAARERTLLQTPTPSRGKHSPFFPVADDERPLEASCERVSSDTGAQAVAASATPNASPVQEAGAGPKVLLTVRDASYKAFSRGLTRRGTA